jgi:hypothetical protein
MHVEASVVNEFAATRDAPPWPELPQVAAVRRRAITAPSYGMNTEWSGSNYTS